MSDANKIAHRIAYLQPRSHSGPCTREHDVGFRLLPEIWIQQPRLQYQWLSDTYYVLENPSGTLLYDMPVLKVDGSASHDVNLEI